MTVTWLGHACFALEEDGYRIIIDPYEGVEGYADVQERAHAVYCSHGHHDHCHAAGVTLLEQRESPFAVEEIAAFHDEVQGAKRGPVTIRVFEAGGIRVCHLGDLGHLLSRGQISAIGKVDVLLIPVGGFYTINAEEAKQVVRQLEPRCVVPMHYRHAPHGLPAVSGVERFLDLFCSGEMTVLPGTSFEVTPELQGILVPSWR